MDCKNQRGAVMLESTYCILISFFILMFMLSYGFFLYQKTLVTIVANQVAEEVSQTYKLRNVKDSESVTAADITGVGKYRYLFFVNSFDTKNTAKAQTLTSSRLTKTSLADAKGGLTVTVETVTDDIGRRHYEVTVSQKYAFLLGDFLELIGLGDTQVLTKTVYVESADVLNYINTVKVTKYGLNEITSKSSALGLINSAISLLHSIFDD